MPEIVSAIARCQINGDRTAAPNDDITDWPEVLLRQLAACNAVTLTEKPQGD